MCIRDIIASFDGGAHWSPLTLNLPAVRVSDIAIQPAQHAVVLATHGRAFWVLDNLQFLEQLSKAQVAGDQPYLFAPQQTWLVKRAMGRPDPNAGQNLPAGASVFFYLPPSYDSRTQVSLSFTTAEGTLIRRFTLPLKPQKTEHGKARKPAKLHPGMNRFQWNLRYPNAVEVKGFHPPDVDEGYDDRLTGPEVLPGTYSAVLDYNGVTLKQPFEVRLDPRLSTTPEQLQARFKLLMQIHDALNRLDSKLNQAIDARSQLQKAIAGKQISAKPAQTVLAALDHDIGRLVQLKIQSSEGDIVYEPKLRSHLALLANDIEINFMPLRQVQQHGFAILSARAKAGESMLQSDIVQAQKLLKP